MPLTSNLISFCSLSLGLCIAASAGCGPEGCKDPWPFQRDSGGTCGSSGCIPPSSSDDEVPEEPLHLSTKEFYDLRKSMNAIVLITPTISPEVDDVVRTVLGNLQRALRQENFRSVIIDANVNEDALKMYGRNEMQIPELFLSTPEKPNFECLLSGPHAPQTHYLPKNIIKDLMHPKSEPVDQMIHQQLVEESLLAECNRILNAFRIPGGQLSDAGELAQALLSKRASGESLEGVCEKIDARSLTREKFVQEYLFSSKPVVLQHAADDWPATTRWNEAYLRSQVGERQVHVKIAPNGEFEGCEDLSLWGSDSYDIPPQVRSQLESPTKAVVRPAHTNMKFSDFLESLKKNESRGRDETCNPSFYVEYLSIKDYLPSLLGELSDFDFARDLKDGPLRNLWVGSWTFGKLHFDAYENFLTVLKGTKKLILFDPTNNTRLYEGHIREAHLNFDMKSRTFTRSKQQLQEATAMVMSPIDPVSPNTSQYPLFKDATPVVCEVHEGETLFLPSFWWHEVHTTPGAEGTAIAVNFWHEPFYTKDFPCKSCDFEVNSAYRSLLDEWSGSRK